MKSTDNVTSGNFTLRARKSLLVDNSGTSVTTTGAVNTNEVSPAQFQTIRVTLQDAITSTATSAAIDVSNYYNHSVQFKMTTSHTTQLEGSIDGTNYVDIGSAVTTSTISLFSGKYKYIRADTTAVSGALTVTIISGN